MKSAGFDLDFILQKTTVICTYLFFILLLTFSHVHADCVTGNSYSGSSSTISPAYRGQSFRSCQLGDLDKIKVLSATDASNVTLNIYYGDGLSSDPIATVTGISLHQATSFDDWSAINFQGKGLQIFRNGEYTFYFGSELSLVYTDNQYSKGKMYENGSVQNGSDLLFVVQIVGAQALSTDLIAFNAYYGDGAIVLQWQTENETNNAGFMIDRSEDNKNWERIASFKTHKELVTKGMFSYENNYTFTDDQVKEEKNYHYRLCEMNKTGSTTYHQPISITTGALPFKTSLINAYPNPFNPTIHIQYQLEKDGYATVQIFDLLGHWVATLDDRYLESGHYKVEWDGVLDTGVQAPSGPYFILMQFEEKTFAQKVLLLR